MAARSPMPVRAPIAALLVATAATVGALGCAAPTEPAADGRPTVVATSSVVADLVRRIGGRRVEVVSLVPPGADPHDYEPLPSDARAVADAALLFRAGGDLDAWLEDMLAASGGQGPVVALLDEVSGVASEEAVPADEAASDPHWWHDPRMTIAAIRAIAAALAEADPGAAGSYRRHARAYNEKLRRLDRGIARCLSRVPRGDRELVTTHEGLGSFAEAYGLRPVGVLIPSRSSDAQPSAGEIAELVARMREQDVPAVFPTSPSRSLESAVAAEAGAAVGGELWTDGLGPPGSDGETYVEAMASNTADLVGGLTDEPGSCRPGAAR